MDDSKKMAVFLVSGFLGAGKTTLIKHFLGTKIEGLGKVALIVNEVGRIGVDGALLSGQDVDMIEVTSGCICCTLKGDFGRAVQEIYERARPDFLIVEATGVAQPGDILDALYGPPANRYSRLRTLVTVVDAEFFGAKDIFGPFYDNQIRCADLILLNKIDLIPPESVESMRASLREINPSAAIHATQYCMIDPRELLGDHWGLARRDDDGHEHFDHHEHGFPGEGGFQTFSFEDDRPLHKEKLEGFLRSLPPNLFRLKGWARLADSTVLVDFTAGRYSLAPWEEPRNTSLTFVGYHCREGKILEALKECLVRGSGES